jgi:signal transduction histidine kinase
VSLRWRLTAALLLVVGVAVGGGTAAHLAEVSRRLEEQLQQQAQRVVSSIETDMQQTGEVLDEEVGLALDPRGFLARGVGAARVQARYLIARSKLQRGRLEVLKMIGPGGEILTSGHWPASYGALDPQFGTYQSNPGTGARIVDEATPAGSAPSLQRWGKGRLGGADVIVVAGRFLDADALARMRARVGADLLALCRPDGKGRATCVAVRDEALLPDRAFALDDNAWRDTLVLERVPLGAGTDPPMLIAGLDRRAIDGVRTGMVQRALAVGGLSIALAMLLGVFLATRQVRPIEALAEAAGRLADGELATRVEAAGGGAETRGLVDAFNHMAADLERGQTRLKQAERVAAWREIARGLAHELKNPLTPILGAMDVVRKARSLGREDFDDILNEQAEAVVEEVMRLKELADAFSRFARLPDPKLEPLKMHQVIDNAVALYASDDAGAVRVERRFAAEVPDVVADRTQVATAVTNLIKNAVEAMEGEGTLTLRLRPRPPDDSYPRASVELVVEDSGPGISEEVREKLFMPYVTTKGSRGTGLGLALVHRIVMEHEGAIEVGDASDGGAAFSVRLPVDGPAPRAPRAPAGEDAS